VHALLADYDAALPAITAEGERMRALVEARLGREPGLDLHSVAFRVKSRASLAGKLARPDRTYARLWDVTDLFGLRVIVFFEDSVDRVARIIESELAIDYTHSVDKRRQRDAVGFGYRSLHYVCGFGGAGALPAEARFEIQLRTALQHAWAEIEHDLGYKAEDRIPAAARRRFSRVASLLELADSEFVAVREDLERYRVALPDRIARRPGDVPLDRLSLATLLDQPEVRAADGAVAEALGKPLGETPFFPDYLLKMLAAAGLDTVGDVRDALDAHGHRIPGMVRPYFAFAAATWSLSPERMPVLLRGYGLFFLAHTVVLDDASLGIRKVERLTQLYRELDYPDDERAASAVASRLLDALRAADRAGTQ
jgi:putative GTP pyrophosphokinase